MIKDKVTEEKRGRERDFVEMERETEKITIVSTFPYWKTII